MLFHHSYFQKNTLDMIFIPLCCCVVSFLFHGVLFISLILASLRSILHEVLLQLILQRRLYCGVCHPSNIPSVVLIWLSTLYTWYFPPLVTLCLTTPAILKFCCFRCTLGNGSCCRCCCFWCSKEDVFPIMLNNLTGDLQCN